MKKRSKKFVPFTVTVDYLKSRGACTDQIYSFIDTFGKRVRVTAEVLRKHGGKFDLEWLVEDALSHATGLKTMEVYRQYNDEMQDLFDTYRAEKHRVLRPFDLTKYGNPRKRIIWKGRDEALDPVQKKFHRVKKQCCIRYLGMGWMAEEMRLWKRSH